MAKKYFKTLNKTKTIKKKMKTKPQKINLKVSDILFFLKNDNNNILIKLIGKQLQKISYK